ncbi:hypothetical protein Cgig2_019759 [Carnegiea gigantea]|uniref:Uncharacterized protein n=1 Tax=Carnegiea gigantea TaxID=171969 RepID=A0A9Q1KLE6_9CARY|nr:hypothetical protein Cgig2_019759 [Carnegiea gigantea]
MNFSPSSSSKTPNHDEQNRPILSTNNHPSNPTLYHNPNLNHNAPPNPNPNPSHDPSPSCSYINAAWSFAQDKEFERLLIESSEWDESTRWQRIAAQLGGGRTAAEVEEHYQKLVHDVELIESGIIPYPSYDDDDDSLWYVDDDAFTEDSGEEDGENFDKSTSSTPPSGGEQVGRETKKGAKWTDDEHRLFLIGLKKYRKGDWRSISRNLVTTRCPTQVASHAQKFFLRLEAPPKERKRYSIHDTTTVDSDSLADLFHRGLIDASNVDDDSLADLIHQGLVCPGSTSTAAQPSVDATVQPSHNMSPDLGGAGLQLDENTISNYMSMGLPHGANISLDHAGAGLQLDENTTSNYMSMGLPHGSNISPDPTEARLQSDPNTTSNYMSMGLPHGANFSTDHAGARLQLDPNTTSNYMSMGLPHGANFSTDHAEARLQLDPNTTSNYISMELQQHGTDTFPNHGWASVQPSPDISPNHAWASVQPSPDISPNHAWMSMQPPSLQLSPDISPPNHVLADQQNPSANTFQPTSYVSSNHIILDQQNPSSSSFQADSYISNEILEILQSDPTIDPSFHLPEHYDHYKQL